ncbi:type II toxin-antitoxin system VapC family toxin [Rhizobium straminoryzae]|uniref:Ribonuclease VapC n=1 Tax=Rhizobium straminoryzae TaxID=1387186 RepID=A0A549TB11_9HYPH|nr:PIN domain-containing protein [Rhizobium straminoryzae]TRL39065.1 PIN domain-containing protein [Rhizobium straminoryzae]
MTELDSRLYVDTNVLIYIIDGNDYLRQKAKQTLNSLRPKFSFVTSELTVGECLRGALRRGNNDSAENYRRLLSNRAFITLAPVTLSLIERAAELGASLDMKLIDSLHVATAEACGCRLFITNDRGIRAPAGLALQSLSEA